MPKIQKIFTLDVTPEKFLNSCSAEELIELVMLVNKPIYQTKIENHINIKNSVEIEPITVNNITTEITC